MNNATRKFKFMNTNALMFYISFLFLFLACTSQQTKVNVQQPQPKITVIDTPEVPIDTIKKDPEPGELFTVDYIMGHFDPATHPDFEKIDIKYADREGLFLRKDTYKAFREMYNHAASDGIRLQIRSATRNFNYQKGIWESKWNGTKLIEGGENLAETTPDPKQRALKILRYSSMPGTSRHHWGTDIDLNNFDNSWFEKGEGLDIYNWLTKHASEHGFCQTYTAGREHGYQEERWHWTFMPVSEKLTALAEKELKNEMIKGFLGSESAALIDVVKYYVLGINNECK